MTPIVLSGNEEQNPQLVQAANHNGPDQDQQNLELASDSAALKEQMTRMESGWEEEKMRLLKALRSERAIRKEAQKGLKVKNKDKDEELTAKLHSHIAELSSENAVLVEQLLREVDEKVESIIRVQELEENIKLLTQNNPDLQVQLLQTPSQLLKAFEDHITELDSENAALKEQLATKESGWEEEKDRILTALRSERAIRKQTQNDLKTKEKEYQEQIDSLSHHLDVKENELRLAEQFWTGERDRISASWEDKIAKVSEIWERQLEIASVQKNLLAKSLEEESDRKVSQVVLEKDEVIAQLTATNEALKVQRLERETQLEEKERQLIQSEEDHNTKLAALEADLKTKEKEYQEQIDSLSHHLDVKENELRLAEKFWTGERDRVSASWEEKAAKITETWEKELQLALVQKDLLAKSLQEESDRKVSQVVLEKDEVIAQLTAAIEALKVQSLERETQLEEKERQLIQSEEDHNTKLAALEADLKTKEKEYQEQIDSLSHHLDVKENELRLAEQFWTGERDRVSASWEEKAAKITETWEKELQLALVQKDLLAKSLQEESDRKVSQVVLEKDEVIAQLTAANEALKVQSLERETQLEEKERQLIQSEEDHNTKLAALESDLRSQLASQEETIEELRRNASDMEQHWTNQISFMKDQVQVLNNITTTLQARVLSLQESNQENMTSEELKAQKKKLKRLIEEKEKEEKRQKKERKEREEKEKKEKEKREKEELKRLKKERQEREKKERRT